MLSLYGVAAIEQLRLVLLISEPQLELALKKVSALKCLGKKGRNISSKGSAR